MPNTSRKFQVAIAGAGFAGLASAALLARGGHRVRVFEKFTQAQSLGAGILVQPSGLAAMRVLGIEQEVLRQGARVQRLYGVAASGRKVMDLKYDDWQPGAFGVGLHRGVLFEALWRLAVQHGVEVVTGHEVDNLKALAKDNDVVVIADGCRSRLRTQTGLPLTDRVYPWGAVWAVLDDPERRHGSTLWQWYRGAGQMLGIMPTGCAPGSDRPVVSLFWSLRADRLQAWRERGLDAFKQELLALHPACGWLLESITSLDQLTWARYHDIVMPRYHTGHCVVIGDAAHATSPQLGQGTNLALLDAVALAHALREVTDVPQALEQYTQQRQGHTHFYGQASRWLTPLFQSDQRMLPWLRDVFLASSAKWPVVGALTRETLVGMRRGWLPGQPLQVPALEGAPATAHAP